PAASTAAQTPAPRTAAEPGAGAEAAVPPVPDIPEPRKPAGRTAGHPGGPGGPGGPRGPGSRPHPGRPDAEPRELVRELPVHPADVCALGRRHGRWHPDSPEARICAGVQGG
ncbi:hypothetical protein J7E98_31450, partial [Streptomyces sp. ISL-86]|nr:hypothetical protein [Streptomyces sp. ISL-86]